jgi:hypothetical protein
MTLDVNYLRGSMAVLFLTVPTNPTSPLWFLFSAT